MKKGLVSLLPIAVMILLLIAFSVYYGGVSNAPLLVIFVITAIVSVSLTRGKPLNERVEIFFQRRRESELAVDGLDFYVVAVLPYSAGLIGGSNGGGN